MKLACTRFPIRLHGPCEKTGSSPLSFTVAPKLVSPNDIDYRRRRLGRSLFTRKNRRAEVRPRTSPLNSIIITGIYGPIAFFPVIASGNRIKNLRDRSSQTFLGNFIYSIDGVFVEKGKKLLRYIYIIIRYFAKKIHLWSCKNSSNSSTCQKVIFSIWIEQVKDQFLIRIQFLINL